jgi:hypothetical protein
VASGERDRVESAEKPEDAVRKVQHLKKAMGRVRAVLGADGPAGADALSNPAELAAEMKSWDDALEVIRAGFSDLIAERDRWRIAHDKLRERTDHHALEPRSQPDRIPQSALQPSPRRMASNESQDFTAIDEQLERLNASMLRAFSSSE